MQILESGILYISKMLLNLQEFLQLNVFVTICIPHGEDEEKQHQTSQHCHHEPKKNKQVKLNVCTHILHTVDSQCILKTANTIL